MWRSTVGGESLRFRLMGVNNQNFIMEDEATGTWWQQISGQALHGPLAGEQLTMMPFETVSFGIWKQENPTGVVLAPEQKHLGDYFEADWVDGLQGAEELMPVPRQVASDGDLDPRDLVVGIEIEGHSKAYALATLVRQNPIVDQIGSVPLLLTVAADGKTVRVFDRRVDGAALEIYLRSDLGPPILIDAGSGTEFDFRGVAIAGELADRELSRVDAITEFWFDWHNYHPDTWIYEGGSLPGR